MFFFKFEKHTNKQEKKQTQQPFKSNLQEFDIIAEMIDENVSLLHLHETTLSKPNHKAANQL